jgi:hypothetical protein
MSLFQAYRLRYAQCLSESSKEVNLIANTSQINMYKRAHPTPGLAWAREKVTLSRKGVAEQLGLSCGGGTN